MNRFSSVRGNTATVRMAQPSAPLMLLYLCEHKGLRAGGFFRGQLAMRCPACNAKKEVA